MLSFISQLEALYPTAKWYDKAMVKNAYTIFLKSQILIINPLRGRQRKPSVGLVEKKVNCRFHKWYLKVVKTTMRENNDGLVTIYFDNKVDHLHSKFLKTP